MKKKKYHVYIESSQAGGDHFGVTIWKKDVTATFWGTMQDAHDLGQSIIDEVQEMVDMFDEMERKIIVVSKEKTTQKSKEVRINE